MFYFAYGSNTNEKQLKARIGNFARIGKGKLDNYTFVYDMNVRGGVYANLKKSNEEVIGMVYNLSPEQFDILNYYEGVPFVYYRKKVNITVYNQKIKAFTYIMTDTLKENCKPTKKYYYTIYNGYVEHDLPLKQMRGNGYENFRVWDFKTWKK